MVDTIPSDELIHLDSRIDYVPTPFEIAQACEHIRGQWSLSERRRRFVGDQLPDEPFPAWHPPTVDTSLFRMSTFRRTSDLAS